MLWNETNTNTSHMSRTTVHILLSSQILSRNHIPTIQHPRFNTNVIASGGGRRVHFKKQQNQKRKKAKPIPRA